MSTQLKPLEDVTDHVQGNPGAPITLVEYGDYQCPHCGHAYPIVKQIQKHLGDQLKFIFRNFPLKKAHPLAMAAALAAEAAGRQNKFWEMHDTIFENQLYLNEDSFRLFAEDLGLDLDQFNRDINDEELVDEVDSDFGSGIVSGVNGTPTFFINGMRYNGSCETADLLSALNLAIKKL